MPNKLKSDVWLIQNDPPPKDGDKLNNLHIAKTPTGYDLMDGSKVLASSTRATPRFDNVPHDSEVWDLQLNGPLSPGKDGKGKWHEHGKRHEPSTPPPTGPQDGDFTAQAGSGLGEEPGVAERGKTASSAKG